MTGRRVLLGLPLLFLAVACGGDAGTDPGAGAPASLAVVAGSEQRDTVGATLAAPLRVEVRDEGGAPVPDVVVSFRITRGGGELDPATATTGSDGRAEARWTLGPERGDQRAEARVSGVPPVTFTALAAPGRVADILISLESVTLPAAETVLVETSLVDRNGNPILDRPPVAWTARDPGIATAGPVESADPDSAGLGRIVGRAPGTTIVDLESEGTTASANVEVVEGLADRRLFLVVDERLVVARADGSDTKTLTGGHNPRWSPDGGSIAVNGPGEGVSFPGIHVVDAATGAATLNSTGRAEEPAWSPDGDSLAYLGITQMLNAPTTRSVRVGARGETADRTITAELGGTVTMGEWSPTASAIAYLHARDAWVVRTDGSEAVRITPRRANPEAEEYVRAVWSPDGGHLAVEGVGFCGAECRDVHLVRADGDIYEVLGRGRDVAWHPDGDRIALTRVEGGRRVIGMISITTKRFSGFPAAVGEEQVGPVSWSADGSLLLYGVEADDGFLLAAVSVDATWSRILDPGTFETREGGTEVRVGALLATRATWAWRP